MASSTSLCDKLKDALKRNDVEEIGKISETLKARVSSVSGEVAFQQLLESGKLHQYKLGPLDMMKGSLNLQLSSSNQRLTSPEVAIFIFTLNEFSCVKLSKILFITS